MGIRKVAMAGMAAWRAAHLVNGFSITDAALLKVLQM
jgi:hypothetical protein